MKNCYTLLLLIGLLCISTISKGERRTNNAVPPTHHRPKKGAPVVPPTAVLLFEELKKDFGFTDAQQLILGMLVNEKEAALTESLKSAKTEEEKSELRKASDIAFFAKLKENLGEDIGDRIVLWYTVVPDKIRMELINMMEGE